MLMKEYHFNRAKYEIIVTCGVSYWAKSDVMCSKSTVETMEGLKDTRILEDTRTISIDVVLVMSYFTSSLPKPWSCLVRF